MAATLIGVFFTPLFYWAAMTYLGGNKRRGKPAVDAAAAGTGAGPVAASGAHAERRE